MSTRTRTHDRLGVGNIKHGSLRERFYARALMRDGCWGWRNKPARGGYAHMLWQGKTHRAHRLSWRIHHGPIPDGLCVLHRCDNPMCTNPAHLFLGTDLDNVRDRDLKGRQARQRGSACGAAKLTDDDVVAIRAESARRGLVAALARRYGVSHSLISMIRSGRVWGHLKEAV